MVIDEDSYPGNLYLLYVLFRDTPVNSLLILNVITS